MGSPRSDDAGSDFRGRPRNALNLPNDISCNGQRPLFPKVIADRFGLRSSNDRRERCRVSLLHCLHAAKVFQQSARCARAYAGNFQQFGGAVAHLATLAMKGHGKAVGLIANELNQVQHWRVMIERDRIFFLPVDVKNLFTLGDRGQRLIDDLQRRPALRRPRAIVRGRHRSAPGSAWLSFRPAGACSGA